MFLVCSSAVRNGKLSGVCQNWYTTLDKINLHTGAYSLICFTHFILILQNQIYIVSTVMEHSGEIMHLIILLLFLTFTLFHSLLAELVDVTYVGLRKPARSSKS